MAKVKTVYIKSSKANEKLSFADFLVPVILLLGVMLLFLPFHEANPVPCIVAGTIFMVMCEVFTYRGYSKFILAGILFAAAIIFFIPFSNGAMTLFNNIVLLINNRFATQYTMLEVPFFNALAGQVFFSVFYGAVAMLISELYTKRRFMLIALLIFVLTEAELVLRVNLSILIYVFCGILIVWLFIRGLNKHIVGSVPSNLSLGIVSVMAIFIICAACLSSFDGSWVIAKISTTAVNKVHNIRYSNDHLPKGNMKLAARMYPSDKEVFKVTLEYPMNEYLRGFCGAEYTDGVWQKHSGRSLSGEWNGLFRWLARSDFYTQFQNSANADVITPNIQEMTVSVENVGADRCYIYAPQLIKSINGNYAIKDDLSVKANGLTGQKRYSFVQTIYPESSDELILNFEKAERPNDEYARISNVYSVFADDVYKKIDLETKQMLEELFFSGDYVDDDQGIYSTITRIRAVLELRTDYKSEPAAYNGEKEFCDWFLNDIREGNSAYYATAGAMALRAAGIPARYCEGYYIPRGAVGEITLTEANAHAWTEVYLENLGWVQIEFTPGFYQSAFKTEQIVEISKDISGGGGDEETPYELSEEYKENEPPKDLENNTFDFTLIILLIIIAPILAVALMIIRYLLIHLLRRRNFEKPNAEHYMYEYIYRVLLLGGVKCMRTRPLECVDMVSEKFTSIRREEYVRMVAIMQKSVFGEKKLEEHEIRTLCKFKDKAVSELYKKSNLLKRIKLKFINVI